MAEELDNCYAINLTDETHDQSFAMTSSFSNMYLAAYLCFNLDKLNEKTTVNVESLIIDFVPCPSGEVNRVVKGVTLYPYTCI